ncbi:MAG: ECF-type sigma factor [Bryobacteraceae bacterium]
MPQEPPKSDTPRPTGELLQSLYPELRRRARAVMRKERVAHTLQPTALLHEAVLRLIGDNRELWDNDREFLIRAAQHMESVVVDYARRKRAQKRNSGIKPEPLSDAHASQDPDLDRVIGVAEAIGRLRATDERAAQVAVMRFFLDLSERETAEVLGLSAKTVERDWQFARAWLRMALAGQAG